MRSQYHTQHVSIIRLHRTNQGLNGRLRRFEHGLFEGRSPRERCANTNGECAQRHRLSWPVPKLLPIFLHGHVRSLLVGLALLPLLLSFIASRGALRMPLCRRAACLSRGGCSTLRLRRRTHRSRRTLGTAVPALTGITHHRALAYAIENMRP
jgi:hypothetical protein